MEYRKWLESSESSSRNKQGPACAPVGEEYHGEPKNTFSKQEPAFFKQAN